MKNIYYYVHYYGKTQSSTNIHLYSDEPGPVWQFLKPFLHSTFTTNHWKMWSMLRIGGVGGIYLGPIKPPEHHTAPQNSSFTNHGSDTEPLNGAESAKWGSVEMPSGVQKQSEIRI